MTAPPSRSARLRLTDGAIHVGEYLSDDLIRLGGATLGSSEVTFLPCAEPTKVVGIGLNYRDHPAEIGMTVPAEPVIFLKPPSSVTSHRSPIIRAKGVHRLDYEGELAVVIGRRASGVPEEAALDYVEGLTVGNDVTAREFQTPGSQWTRAKGYDTFAPIGPCLLHTTKWSGRKLETRVNGRVVQSATTDQLIVGVPRLIAIISAFMTLEPGDVILTGTPAGVGAMNDGDVVEVEIEGIGSLCNVVVSASGDAATHMPSVAVGEPAQP